MIPCASAVRSAAATVCWLVHSRASNGHSSTQIPQYMHSDQSMTNRSSTFVVRSLVPGGRFSIGSVCESMLMHQLGHSRAQIMHDVHADPINLIDPCAPVTKRSLSLPEGSPKRSLSPPKHSLSR